MNGSYSHRRRKLMDFNFNGIIAGKLYAFRLPPLKSMPRILPLPNFGCAIRNLKLPNFGAAYLGKSAPSSFHLCKFGSLTGLASLRPAEAPPVGKGKISTEKMIVDGFGLVGLDSEAERKRKMGHANKGKVPWNKGRKHSEETRERIRQRTKEALKDPKIRKKMSECPRTLSNRTKARIRASLTKLWGERLNWKRSRERFLESWAQRIAEAARIGASDQQELDWDSYDKIKREIAMLHLHKAAEKAKAKEIARIRAERSAKEKAEKMALLAQRRKEQEEKSKVRREPVRRRNRRSIEEKEKMAEFQEVKLKERLMKIHKKKSTIVNQVDNQPPRSWEKFDMDLLKGGQLRKEVSLADQIRLAKNKRTELLDNL